MTKIFLIHPSVHDVQSFLKFTFLEGKIAPESLEWSEDAPDVLFASEWTYYKSSCFQQLRRLYPKAAIKVGFMGEAVSADMNLFDYAVGFDNTRSADPRFVRLPSPGYMFKGFLRESANSISTPEQAMEELERKTGFCNFIYSNPKAHPFRDQLFHALEGYKRVDSLGRHLNNTGRGGTGYGGGHAKECVNLKADYRFSVASENARYSGYTTEKVLTSLEAHTVPIYWGNPCIFEDINPRCIIDANRFSTLEEVVEEVRKIDNDPQRWAEMVCEPWFTPEQEERNAERTEQYIAGMKAILSGNAPAMVPEGFHVNLYRAKVLGNSYPFDSKAEKIVSRIKGL